MNSIGFTKDSLKQTEVMNDWKGKSRIGLSSLSKMQNLRDATRAMEYFLVVARSTLRPSIRRRTGAHFQCGSIWREEERR